MTKSPGRAMAAPVKVPLKDGQGRFRVDEIDVPDRLRGLNEDRLLGLVESMRAIGLRSPITVVTVTGDKDNVDGHTLVAGLHRLEAARRLGWKEIDAILADDLDNFGRRIWEIDENLQRVELTVHERADYLVRRRGLWDQRRRHEGYKTEDHFWKPDFLDRTKTGSSCAGLGGRGKKGFAAETAAVTGMSKSAINKSINRHSRIAPEVWEQVKGMPEIADKGVELDALASMNPAEQRRAVEMVRDGEARSVRDAKRKLGVSGGAKIHH